MPRYYRDNWRLDSRAIVGTSVPGADAMMIIAGHTRTDPRFPRCGVSAGRVNVVVSALGNEQCYEYLPPR